MNKHKGRLQQSLDFFRTAINLPNSNIAHTPEVFCQAALIYEMVKDVGPPPLLREFRCSHSPSAIQFSAAREVYESGLKLLGMKPVILHNLAWLLISPFHQIDAVNPLPRRDPISSSTRRIHCWCSRPRTTRAQTIRAGTISAASTWLSATAPKLIRPTNRPCTFSSKKKKTCFSVEIFFRFWFWLHRFFEIGFQAFPHSLPTCVSFDCVLFRCRRGRKKSWTKSHFLFFRFFCSK